MFLSKEDSTQLWEGVKGHNYKLFDPINTKLLNPQGAMLRHLPVRLYLPHTIAAESDKPQNEDPKTQTPINDPVPGSLRVMQSLIAPALTSRKSPHHLTPADSKLTAI